MNDLLKLLPKRQPIIVRYGATALFVAIAFAIRYSVGENAGPYAFLLFILPILASALLFDRGTGLFATALSIALISILLPWDYRARVHIAALSLFAFVSCCLVFVAEGLHRALEEAHKANEATELLLQEMSHRVKNKFTVISSIISLQGRQSTPEVRKALDDVRSRVNVIASVHNYLQRSRQDGLIEMREYLVGLCHSLEAALDNSAQNISLVCTSIELLLPPDKALAIGLIVNELVTNAFKYAFVNGGAGCVLVDLSVENGRILLSVSDDGVGCAQEHREGLGTRLIKTFVQQLGGSVRRQEINLGCRIVVEFPAP